MFLEYCKLKMIDEAHAFFNVKLIALFACVWIFFNTVKVISAVQFFYCTANKLFLLSGTNLQMSKVSVCVFTIANPSFVGHFVLF